ncbi:rab effector Noc2-like [Artemia franciscana]|uniref:rab effector Noc2-like n=1 Tax=Artemia franciscana TaxID=6661 RepID=UPI0032D9B9C5
MDFNEKDAWVPPNDRQLALRAKLRTGWSVKTRSFQSFNKPESLSEKELEVIRTVMARDEQLGQVEQERVGKLMERMENMKRLALGDGINECLLCGERFNLFTSASQLKCHDCKKVVCTKCGVDTVSSTNVPIWLCKICSEQREMWKKSGAWFFKSMPKYTIPIKKQNNVGKYARYARSAPSVSCFESLDYNKTTTSTAWAKKISAKSQTSSEQDDGSNSSDEDQVKIKPKSPLQSAHNSRYSLNIIGR